MPFMKLAVQLSTCKKPSASGDDYNRPAKTKLNKQMKKKEAHHKTPVISNSWRQAKVGIKDVTSQLIVDLIRRLALIRVMLLSLNKTSKQEKRHQSVSKQKKMVDSSTGEGAAGNSSRTPETKSATVSTEKPDFVISDGRP